MTRKHWITLLKLAVAAALVAYVLTKVNFEDTTDQDGKTIKGLLTLVKEMDLPLFAAGALCYFIAASFSSVRWWWLLRVNELDVSLRRAFALTWIGVFFNNVIPGLTGGDVVKAVYVARETGRKLRPVLSVLVDRALGLLSLALLAAVVILFSLDVEEFRWIAFALWAGLIGLGLVVLVFLSRRIRQAVRFDSLLTKLPGHGILMQIDEAFTHYRGHIPGIVLWLILSSFNHLLSVFGVFLIGEALQGVLPFVHYVIFVPIIHITTALPLAPAGWGVGEAFFSYFWEHYGTPYVATMSDPAQFLRTQGVALSLVYRCHLVLWSLIGAVFLLFEKGRPSDDDAKELLAEAEAQAEAEHDKHMLEDHL